MLRPKRTRSCYGSDRCRGPCGCGCTPDTDTADLAFGVTLDQIDTLNRLIETITAHGDVVAATDIAEFADGTLSVVGHAIFDAAGEVREVLYEVNAQRLGPVAGVRETRAVYAVEAGGRDYSYGSALH